MSESKMSNRELIFKAVEAVVALEGLQSKDKHAKSVAENIGQYLVQDLRLLAFNFGISREAFLEALKK